MAGSPHPLVLPKAPGSAFLTLVENNWPWIFQLNQQDTRLEKCWLPPVLAAALSLSELPRDGLGL